MQEYQVSIAIIRLLLASDRVTFPPTDCLYVRLNDLEIQEHYYRHLHTYEAITFVFLFNQRRRAIFNSCL